MIQIKGIPLDEKEDLSNNLDKLHLELDHKFNFWITFNRVLSKHGPGGSDDPGILYKSLLFIGLLPKFLSFLFARRKRELIHLEAQNELIRYYSLPETKIRRFRLQCEHECSMYEEEIRAIDEEIRKQLMNFNSPSIGEHTRKEIRLLLDEFEVRKKRKQSKLDFYNKCEQRLLSIEEHLKIKKSIMSSKQRLEELEEGNYEARRQKEVEQEFELFQYYGELLDDISLNLKRLEQEENEEVEKLELKEMLTKLKIKN